MSELQNASGGQGPRRSRTGKPSGAAGLLLMLLASHAHAGALYVYETANPTDIAFAAAGLAGRAQDAGTVFTNPAGMARFKDSAMLASGGATYIRAEWDSDIGQTVPGSEGHASRGWLPYGTFGYIHPFSDRLKFGVHVGNNFGLGLDWKTDWVGRYSATKANLFAPQVQPTVAYKVNDWLSVGAGASLTMGYLEGHLRINNPPALEQQVGDGKLRLRDTDTAVQGNFGIMLNPTENTRIGLRYLTETTLEFEDDPSIKRVTPVVKALTDAIPGLDLEMKMPQSVMLGIHHQLNDKWAILGSVGWEEWSEFGGLEIRIGAAGEERVDLNYDDVYHVGIGAEYQYDSKWRFSAGASYDSALSNGAERSPMIPMGEMIRIGGGAEYKKRSDLTIGGAMDIMWEGDLTVQTPSGPGNLSGEYKNVYLAFLTVYAKWQ